MDLSEIPVLKMRNREQHISVYNKNMELGNTVTRTAGSRRNGNAKYRIVFSVYIVLRLRFSMFSK